jgi:enoyl-CoA hydratase/carnithine racemase
MKEDRAAAKGPRASLKFVEQGYCNKPLVAAIRGHCVGQGIAVALSCDLRVCASDAIFSAPEVAHGMAIGGLGALIVRAIGLPAATELCLLADKRDAAWALKWGMAHQVVLPGEEEAAAEKLALRLAGMDSAAMQVSKQSLQKSVDLSFQEVVEFAEPLRQEIERARQARKAAGGH